jgi:transposase, IS30 family
LFGVVHHFLKERWSPEQIALTLASIYPKCHELRVSTETIYNCIYAQPVGQLKKDLIQAPRHAHNKLVPRSKGQDRCGQIPDMISIHLRPPPPHIEDRLFPGHWEGDLIKGAANASAVGTLVGCASRLLIYKTGIEVYFCDPRSPWQRGSNENMNGLIRKYLPKGTDLSVYSQAQLDAIADQINNRPRKGFGGKIPTSGVLRTAAKQSTTFTLTH